MTVLVILCFSCEKETKTKLIKEAKISEYKAIAKFDKVYKGDLIRVSSFDYNFTQDTIIESVYSDKGGVEIRYTHVYDSLRRKIYDSFNLPYPDTVLNCFAKYKYEQHEDTIYKYLDLNLGIERGFQLNSIITKKDKFTLEQLVRQSKHYRMFNQKGLKVLDSSKGGNIFFVYKYDNWGNWIERITYGERNKPKGYTIREITYYIED